MATETLADWIAARQIAGARLGIVLDKYRAAAASLTAMERTPQSVRDNAEIAWTGFSAQMDTTNYLADWEAMLNLWNRLACVAGAKAIADNVHEVAGAMANLRALDEAFGGSAKYTEAEAWAYLDRVNNFLQEEVEKRIAMDMAGY